MIEGILPSTVVREEGSKTTLSRRVLILPAIVGTSWGVMYGLDHFLPPILPEPISPQKPKLETEETKDEPITELTREDAQAVADEINTTLARLFNEETVASFGAMTGEHLIAAQDDGRLSLTLARYEVDERTDQEIVELILHDRDRRSLSFLNRYFIDTDHAELLTFINTFEWNSLQNDVTTLGELEDRLVAMLPDGEYKKQSEDELVIFVDSINREFAVDISMEPEIRPFKNNPDRMAVIDKRYRLDRLGKLSADYLFGIYSGSYREVVKRIQSR